MAEDREKGLAKCLGVDEGQGMGNEALGLRPFGYLCYHFQVVQNQKN